MSDSAMPLVKGEMPEKVRTPDAEVASLRTSLKEKYPDFVVILERRPGGNVRTTVSVQGHGLTVKSGEQLA